MCTTIKPNLSSSSDSCSLAELKRHIKTCLQRWRKNNSIKIGDQHKNQHQDIHKLLTLQEEKTYCSFQQNSRGWLGKGISKEYSFDQRNTINIKLQKFITTRQRFNNINSATFSDSEGPRKYGRKVEIVAKLLAITLIAKKPNPVASVEKEEVSKNHLEFIRSSSKKSRTVSNRNKMTVSELTFLDLRAEYPELNSEIRSILTTRAQEGSTISQIRADYRKLTGLTFPVHENVTEFLLTIPRVTAYCSEKGTRIFNVMPVDETKHIHDMVMKQKPQTEVHERRASNNYYYRERLHNNNYQSANWRRNITDRLYQMNTNFPTESEPLNFKNSEHQRNTASCNNRNLSRDNSEVCYENNCFYQDNCNYLFNRICNQKQQEHRLPELIEMSMQPLHQPSVVPCSSAGASAFLNNDATKTSYKNNVNHLNNLIQFHQEQKHEFQQNLNSLRSVDGRRPSHNSCQSAMPTLSRSSSPFTKSDSGYTEGDFQAHLLDFLLLGDDFFLYMARMELKCKFRKNQRILQSGLCVSGQNIVASMRRVRALNNENRSIILNIGSVDIMQGKKLIQIEHDFRELLGIMAGKGINPILTTLAPLANYSHESEMKRMLERFNDFIKREGKQRNLIVIDVFKCLVNEKGQVLFDCFQSEPRNVSGTTEPYLFWNKIGRQRVLQLIKSNLEY